MSSFGGGGWGAWHTSDVIPQDCPQGCGRHTVTAAHELNEKDAEARRARMRELHERWLNDGKPEPSTTVSTT